MSVPVADQICSLADVMQSAITQVLDFFFQKLQQLKRLTAMLEQLGFSIQLPELEKLLALSQITIEVYEQLQKSCPQLNLPPVPGNIDKIREQVSKAYGALAGGLQLHPWAQMGGLQSIVDMYAGQANQELGKLMGNSSGGNIMACLTALCGADSSELEKKVSAPVAEAVKQLSTASNNQIQIDLGGKDGSINLLNTNQKQLRDHVTSYRDAVLALDDVPLPVK